MPYSRVVVEINEQVVAGKVYNCFLPFIKWLVCRLGGRMHASELKDKV